MLTGDTQRECTSKKQQENRYWDLTIFVPDGMKPIDIITAYPYTLKEIGSYHQQGLTSFMSLLCEMSVSPT